MRVLVVEDERMLADAIAEWLREETHAVDVVNDGPAALERIGVNDYDVVVLDRNLPLLHGDDVCRGRDQRPGDRAVPRRRRLPHRAVRLPRDGRFLLLSKKEFAVLTELLRAAHVDPFTGAVRLTILKLRRKLGDPPLIETTLGVGYRIP